MRVYITGSTGLVGSAIVKELESFGDEVFTSRFDLLAKDTFFPLVDYLKRFKIDLIIHCAGKVGGIRANSENNQEFFRQNYEMGINIIECARFAEVPFFINLASTCAYPSNRSLPLKESEFFEDRDSVYETTNEGYAVAKQAIASEVEFEYGVRGITVIPCNVYGVNDRYFKGSHVIPDLIQKFHKAKLNGDKEITLYGTGSPEREFINSSDLAYVISGLVSKVKEEMCFPVDLLNVRINDQISIMELATKVAYAVGWTGTIKWNGELNGIKQKPTNIQRLRDMRLSPIPHDFNKGLAEAYQDYLRRFINV